MVGAQGSPGEMTQLWRRRLLLQRPSDLLSRRLQGQDPSHQDQTLAPAAEVSHLLCSTLHTTAGYWAPHSAPADKGRHLCPSAAAFLLQDSSYALQLWLLSVVLSTVSWGPAG